MISINILMSVARKMPETQDTPKQVGNMDWILLLRTETAPCTWKPFFQQQLSLPETRRKETNRTSKSFFQQLSLKHNYGLYKIGTPHEFSRLPFITT